MDVLSTCQQSEVRDITVDSATEEVLIQPCPFVVWLVSRITQKLLDRFSRLRLNYKHCLQINWQIQLSDTRVEGKYEAAEHGNTQNCT